MVVKNKVNIGIGKVFLGLMVLNFLWPSYYPTATRHYSVARFFLSSEINFGIDFSSYLFRIVALGLIAAVLFYYGYKRV